MRCGVCGSRRLSPLAELRTVRASSTASTTLRLLFKRTGLFKARPGVDIPFGRACLDCGAVIMLIGEGARRRLNELEGVAGVADQTQRRFDEKADAWVEPGEARTDLD